MTGTSSSGATAVLSMLHEPADGRASSQRLFRGRPVLAWTLDRLARSRHLTGATILCRQDQLASVQPIAAEHSVGHFVRSPDWPMTELNAISAARRWADGWRGGLLGACEFDRGFDAMCVLKILDATASNMAILVDPAAGLVDPALLDGLVEHSRTNVDVDLVFSPPAPGLSGVLLRRRLVEQLAAGCAHIGMLLAYSPSMPIRDPIAAPSCAPIPSPLARTGERFTLDSDRQINRLAVATSHLNGQLLGAGAEELLRCMGGAPADEWPREIVLELTTRRLSRPIHWPGTYLNISRPDLNLDVARQLLNELGAVDDVRLVLGGVGDPLLHDRFFDILDEAARAGIRAVAIETDLLADAALVDRLAAAPLDVISVFLPAISAATFNAVMGIDGFGRVMGNLQRLLDTRRALGRSTPLLAPTFVKTRSNFAEMEAWYDHWLGITKCAVIAGPSDFSGTIPGVAVAEMEPPGRRPCSRIQRRLTVLCDGRAVSCEQDVTGQQTLGAIGGDTIHEIWSGPMRRMRDKHAAAGWAALPACAACREWHRP